jgi:hypothetical protein
VAVYHRGQYDRLTKPDKLIVYWPPAEGAAGNRGAARRKVIALAAAAIDPGADPRHGGESRGVCMRPVGQRGVWVDHGEPPDARCAGRERYRFAAYLLGQPL